MVMKDNEILRNVGEEGNMTTKGNETCWIGFRNRKGDISGGKKRKKT